MTEEELKNSRKTVKAGVTRIYNFVKDFTDGDLEQILIRDVKLEEQWVKYDEIQSQLEKLNIENEQDRDNFETSYYNAKSAITHIINVTSKSIAKVTIKLPYINIPIFSGEYQAWQSFYDIFESLIHENNSVPKIQKFYYLKSQLKGEALQIIDSISVCSDNYEEAWKLLVDRFDNKQFLVNIHIKSLFEIAQITKDSVTSLRHLINDTKQHLRSLKSLGRPTESWDDMIIYLLTQKLDNQCRREWELRKDANTQELPKLEELYTFLEKRCFSLEAMGTTPHEKTKSQRSIHSHHSTENSKMNTKGCKLCGDFHALYKCMKFLKQEPSERTETVKKLNVCFNCLRDSHNVAQCTSTSTCRLCHRKHNTLIHIERNKTENSQCKNSSGSRSESNATSNEQTTTPRQNFALQQLNNSLEILLATARVNVKDIQGHWQQCRVLLDSASQTNFVTAKLVERLGLRTTDKHIPVGGIGQICTEVNKSVFIHVSSRMSNYNKNLEFLILDKITSELPTVRVDLEKWNLPSNIRFADPSFNVPGEIDMLIGAEIFLDILKGRTIKFHTDIPPIQNTKFGSIISGRVQHSLISTIQPMCLKVEESVETQLRQFWEIEEVYKKHLSIEEIECEKHFEENTIRNDSGRFIVKLPFKQAPDQILGRSYTTAFERFKKLESKFNQNKEFKQQYSQFLEEYLELEHMKEVQSDNVLEGYYLPHHAVLKETSLSTRIRVVFDASATTDNGVSLNSTLMVGPSIQDDLFNILLRFRIHRYVITADIEKMYRQILVEPNDIKYQKILWRTEDTQPIKTYQLQTVTYGTACAPYLAIRCLFKLADDEQANFPLASAIIKRDFYVDDVLTGGKTLKETEEKRDQLSKLLQKGGFRLRKWSTNDSRLLQGLEDTSDDPLIHLDITQTQKTLGLQWNAAQDIILYKVNIDHEERLTKRILLSQIARLYDPLGLLGPIVCKGKILMQQLWQGKSEWDEPVSQDILDTWKSFSSQLGELKKLHIPRRVTIIEPNNIQIHGFCDASEQAYGACIYLRSANNTNCEMHLLCSKAKVAPLKRISLPRLELCGALLLAHLLEIVVRAIDLHIEKTVLWSHSTISLAWIRTPAHKLKTFVANRVAEIQRLTNVHDWRWTSTRHNPADLISRGCYAKDLIEHEQWWQGPQWTIQDESKWPNKDFVLDVPKEVLEYKLINTTCLVSVHKWDINWRYSDLIRLKRVIALCLRFLKLPDRIRRNGPLTVKELNYALNVLIRRAQLEEFHEEIRCLTKNEEIPVKRKLKSLTPFLDSEGLLRVSGRILLNSSTNSH